MRIIPVIDCQTGIVVHARGGRRQEYRPLESRLIDSTHPRNVATALLSLVQSEELYLADLDAIQGAVPDEKLYHDLQLPGATLWIDAGLCDVQRATDVARWGRVIIGLETIRSPCDLADIARVIPAELLIFSLDLRAGDCLGRWGMTPQEVIETVVHLGISTVIVLDLADVGMGQGIATAALCTRTHQRWPMLELIAGGGIRHRADVEKLAGCGVQGALVATALHSGTWGDDHGCGA